jgi:hypothetical protein
MIKKESPTVSNTDTEARRILFLDPENSQKFRFSLAEKDQSYIKELSRKLVDLIDSLLANNYLYKCLIETSIYDFSVEGIIKRNRHLVKSFPDFVVYQKSMEELSTYHRRNEEYGRQRLKKYYPGEEYANGHWNQVFMEYLLHYYVGIEEFQDFVVSKLELESYLDSDKKDDISLECLESFIRTFSQLLRASGSIKAGLDNKKWVSQELINFIENGNKVINSFLEIADLK